MVARRPTARHCRRTHAAARLRRGPSRRNPAGTARPGEARLAVPRIARPPGPVTRAMSPIPALVPALAAAGRHLAPGRTHAPPSAPLRRDRRGSVAILTAIFGGTLAGFVALAVDVGTWNANRSAMQGAADQAAMAASYAIASGTAAAQKEGLGLAASDGYVNGVGGVTVTVNIPPQAGRYTATARAIEVVITQPQQVLLAGSVMSATPVASARAVAVPGPVDTCIMALSPTGYGITDAGLGTVATDCNIYVNSAASALGCDVALAGVIAVTGFDVFLGQPPCGGLGLASVSATDRLRPDAAPTADPYAARVIPAATRPCMPQPTVLQLLQPVLTLSPGTYCGTIAAVGSIVLTPGVYVFDSASLVLAAAATLTGNGVTLVFTSSTGSSYGTLVAAGIARLNLTPMTSGQTAGMVLWLDANGKAPLAVTTALSVLSITGAIYAPASLVSVLGVVATPCTQIVAWQILFAGAASFHHNCAGTGVADVIAYKLLE